MNGPEFPGHLGARRPMVAGFASDAFSLQQVGEALGGGVVVTAAPLAHAVFKIVLLQ